MIILSKDKVNLNFNISDDGIITDLQGNVQKTYLCNNRSSFKGQYLHRILMWTRFGWRDGRIWHVHHIDGNPLNNNINNLEFIKSNDHARLHNTGKKHPHSEETKKKISISCKGIEPPNKGIKGKFHHSEETKKKISENNSHWNKGLKVSDEVKSKISETLKKYWQNKKFNK